MIDAIRGGNPDSLCEELGDLLLQILFHAQIASENGQFDITDVIASISERMVRRQPARLRGCDRRHSGSGVTAVGSHKEDDREPFP